MYNSLQIISLVLKIYSLQENYLTKYVIYDFVSKFSLRAAVGTLKINNTLKIYFRSVLCYQVGT